MASLTINVNEMFGPTFQGEGPHAGMFCYFLRLAGCNQTCRWCDTAYTWAFTERKASQTLSGKQYEKAAELHPTEVDRVLVDLDDLYRPKEGPRNLVISGGEPLIQVVPLGNLCRKLRFDNWRVHIETAGTRDPGSDLPYSVEAFIVSPKLASSGNAKQVRYRPLVLHRFATDYDLMKKSWFKFVVCELKDIDEVDQIVRETGIQASRVFLMPEGTKVEQVLMQRRLEIIADLALERGYSMSLRSHVLIWGDERGR